MYVIDSLEFGKSFLEITAEEWSSKPLLFRSFGEVDQEKLSSIHPEYYLRMINRAENVIGTINSCVYPQIFHKSTERSVKDCSVLRARNISHTTFFLQFKWNWDLNKYFLSTVARLQSLQFHFCMGQQSTYVEQRKRTVLVDIDIQW